MNAHYIHLNKCYTCTNQLNNQKVKFPSVDPTRGCLFCKSYILKAHLENPTKCEGGQSCSETVETLEITQGIKVIKNHEQTKFYELSEQETAMNGLIYLNLVKSKDQTH